MDGDEPVDVARANAQWQRLRETLLDLGHHVEIMPPVSGLPDLVFAANGGIVIGDRALIPRFRHAERAGESRHYASALRSLGIARVKQAEMVNEGEGDFLLTGDRILGGFGPRTDRRAAEEVEEYFGLPVVGLELIDNRFYHLDTALARLDARTVAYWPGAFAPASREHLRDLYPDALIASEEDAAALALNMVSDGTNVIMPPGCETLAREIQARGFNVVPVAMDEMRKSGGGAKCCVLELHPAPRPGQFG
jgi:N-dimethylarginine dimethylaminohydrolase